MSKILDFIKKGWIFEINPETLGKETMTKKEMVAIFNHFDAFWQYDGDPCSEKPHALLKSEKHSNGFIVCKNVLQYSKMNILFANEIYKHVQFAKLGKIDVVVSSAYSAINLGSEVARLIALNNNPEVEYVIAEKDKNDNPTIIRGGINPSKRVLIINELMTTGNGSTWETKQAVLNCNGDKPAPEIINLSFVLVHRSKDNFLPDGSRVYPIFHFDIEDYRDECPYCKAGSEAIKPKVGDNWNIINGRI